MSGLDGPLVLILVLGFFAALVWSGLSILVLLISMPSAVALYAFWMWRWSR